MSPHHSPAYYQIQVEGVLDPRWAAWFGGLCVDNDGTQTVISGLLTDQPALHGLLANIRDLGLCLISVHRLDNGQPGNPGPCGLRRGCPSAAGTRQ